jgi:hypothetical protein
MTSTSELPQRYEAKQNKDILQIEANPLYFKNADMAQQAVDPLNQHVQAIYEEKTSLWGRVKEALTGSSIPNWATFLNNVIEQTKNECNKIAEKAEGDGKLVKEKLSAMGTAIVDTLIAEGINKTKFPSAAAQENLKDI